MFPSSTPTKTGGEQSASPSPQQTISTAARPSSPYDPPECADHPHPPPNNDDDLLDVVEEDPLPDDTQLLLAFMDKAIMATSPKQVNELRAHADCVRKDAEQLTPSLSDPAFTQALVPCQENVASAFAGLASAANRFRISAATWRIAASHYREIIAAARRAGYGKDEVDEIDAWRARCAAQAQRQFIKHDLTQITRLIKRTQTTRKKLSLETIRMIHRLLHHHLFRALQGCRSAGLHAIPLTEHPIDGFDRELLCIESSMRRLIEMASETSHELKSEDGQKEVRRSARNVRKKASRQSSNPYPATQSNRLQTAPQWLEDLWAENEQLVELAIALKAALAGYDMQRTETPTRTATRGEDIEALSKQLTDFLAPAAQTEKAAVRAGHDAAVTADASEVPTVDASHAVHTPQQCLPVCASALASDPKTEPANREALQAEPQSGQQPHRSRETLAAEITEDFKGLLFKLESTVRNGEAPSPELARECDQSLSKLQELSLLQGEDDGRFDPRSMAAPFSAIHAAISALKEPASSPRIALARADGLQIAAADALHTAEAVDGEWAEHLREVAAKCIELRHNELARAAHLERLQLDEHLKSREDEVKDLLEHSVDRVAEMGMLLSGDPVCDGQPSLQAAFRVSSGDRDADSHLTSSSRTVGQDLDDRIQGTIRTPPDTPKGEAARLRLAKLLTQSLSITCRHANTIVEITVNASRRLTEAAPSDRAKIALELAERAGQATTISAALHASLSDNEDGLPLETSQRYKPAWQRSERLGEELQQILIVLSKLFEARNEALKLFEQATGTGAKIALGISRAKKKFDQAHAACDAQMHRLLQLNESHRESTDDDADVSRITTSFSDLSRRIEHERVMAISRVYVRRADLMVDHLRDSIRPGNRLANIREGIAEPLSEVKQMNATLRQLKREDVRAHPFGLSAKTLAKRNAMIATRLVIGLDLLKQLQAVQRKITRLESTIALDGANH
jgi:hypothetical protein